MRDFIVHPEETEAQTPAPTIPQQDFSQKQSADDTQPPRLHGILGQTQDAAEQALEERAENNERYRISVDDETYKQFNKIIANSDNPEETAYKIGTAQKYAEMLDMPLVDAYANLDTLNREYWGEHTTAKGAFKSVVDMLTVGKNNVKIGNLGNKLVDAEKRGDTELVEKLLAEIEAVENESAAYMDNGTPRAWITSTLQAGAQSLPYTGAGVGAAMFGAFIGGAGGAIAAGFGASTYLARGQEYVEMRKKGIRPEIARNVSLVDGAIQGGIETALDFTLGAVGKGVSKATKGLRGNITSAVSEKISNTIAKKIHFGSGLKIATNWLVHGAMNTASEGAEEFLQQTTGDVSQNVAISAENKARAEELKQALSTLEGEYSEALEDELKKAYPQLEEMTLKEIVKDSANAFVEGAKGALALGIFNAGLSGTMRSAKIKSAKGFIDPYGNVEEYLQIRKMSENVKSEEMFSNAVKDSAVFEGMNDEEKAKIVKQIFAEGQARAAEVEAKTRADIEESKDTADNAEASPVDETGERAGKAREYRTETGRLYTEEDTQRRADADDDGKAHGRLLLGDPTRQSLLKDDGNRYGYINYTVDGDNVTIDDFKMTAGREKLSREFFEDFAEKFAGKNIEWNPKHETNIKLKNEIIQNNPNGKGAGLNYFTADTIEDNRARIQIAKTIRENTKNWSDEQVSAGTALLTSAAKAKGVKLADFVNNYFHNGQVITNKESDVSNIAQAAAQHGATMENVFGATQLDKAGRAIIYIGEHGDFNTFSHELGHFFRKTCLDGEALSNAEKEFGVDQNTHQWTTAQEEAFADGFTDYLRTGKAKTKGLESLYKKIAEFIADVFRGLQGQIKLNDNIKAVYDSLLEDDGSGLARARKAVESAKAQEIAEKKAAKEQAQKESEQKKAEEEAKKTDAEKASEKAERVIADYSATTAEKAKAALESAVENAKLIAYHGSAYKFDKFSTDFIGKGEGSQAFGYGLYFTNNEDIARVYATRNAYSEVDTEKLRQLLEDFKKRCEETGYSFTVDNYGTFKDVDEALEYFKYASIDELEEMILRTYRDDDPEAKRIEKEIENIYTFPDGRDLYKVSLTDGKYLLWDENVSSEDVAIVKQALQDEKKLSLPNDKDTYTGAELYHAIQDLLNSDKEASEFLHSLGYKGINYPAGTIHGNGNGARNFVIFKDDDIKIDNHILFQTLPDTAQKINEVINAADSTTNEKVERELSKVTQELSELAKKYGLNIDGYTHSIDNYFVIHDRKRHGNAKQEASRGQLAITDDDIRNIPNVLSAPDYIIFGAKNRQNNDVIIYSKNLDNGSTLYVEERRTRSKHLAANTLYKMTSASDANTILRNPSLYVQNDRGSINIVDVKNEIVKAENATDIKKQGLEKISSLWCETNSESFNETTSEFLNSFTDKILAQQNSVVNNFVEENELLFQLVGKRGFSNLMQHFSHIAGTSHDIKERTFANNLKNNLLQFGVMKQNGELNQSTKYAENGRINVNLFSFSKQGDALLKAFSTGNALKGLDEKAKEKIFAIGGIKRTENGQYHIELPLQKLLLESDGKENETGKYLFTAYPELKNVTVQFGHLQGLKKDVSSIGVLSYLSEPTNNKIVVTLENKEYSDAEKAQVISMAKEQISKQIDAIIQNIEADAEKREAFIDYVKQSKNLIAGLLEKRQDLNPQEIREQLKTNAIYKEAVKAAKNEYSAPVLFQIIGEMGAARLDSSEEVHEGKTRLENLAIAKQMLAEGKDSKTIRLATGWEKGARKWRYEIADDANFKIVIDESTRNQNWKKYNALKKQIAYYDNLTDEERAKQEKKVASLVAVGMLDDGATFSKMEEADRAEFKALQKKQSDFILANTLSEIVDAPELFRAYPQLKDITVEYICELDGEDERLGGYYDKTNNKIVLRNNVSKSEIKSTLLHEIQHAIQDIEGFSRGGSIESFGTKENKVDLSKYAINNLLQEADAIFDAQGDEWKNKVRAYNRAVIDEDYDTVGDIFDELEDDEAFKRYITARSEADAIKSGNTSQNYFVEPYEAYRRIAGEVEARNVQSRMNMTAAERFATLLAATEDVAKKDQIILDKATAAYCQSEENAEKIGEINGVEVFDRLPDGYKIDTTAHAPAGYIYAHNGKSRFSGQRKAVYVVKPEPQIESVRKQYEGTAQWLKAPNGNDTNLTEKQWLQVRTPAFKEFFGDWENDPEHASKIVDENGEPKVCYHVTSENFDTFDISKARANSDIQAFFFSSDTQDWGDMGENTLGVFLNMRNPSKKPYVNQSENNAGIKAREELQAKGFDGTIEAEDGLETEYAVFNANQIKSATDNNGDFDTGNPSILFQLNNAVDLTADFADVKNGKITEADIDAHINSLIGNIIDTNTEPLKIQITAENKIHVVKSNLNLKGTQKHRHDSALLKIEKIINNAVKTGEEDVDFSHNSKKKTKAHKQNVLKYIAFETPIKIGKQLYKVTLKAERVKGQNENILDLYNVKTNRLETAATNLIALQTSQAEKIPRVESLQTRSLGNSNSSTLFQFVNNEEELFNEAKKYKTWEEFRDAQEAEDTTSHYKAADIEEPVDIEQFAKESEAVLNAKSEELQRLDSEIADLEARAEIYGDAFLDAEYLQELEDERRVLEADIAGNFNFGDMKENAESWLSDTDARNAFYKTIWESAKEAAEKEEYSDENRKAAYIQAGGDETEAAESEKDRQFYDFISKDEYALSQFLKEVAYIAKEANREITDDNRPSDEEELAMYEEKQRLLDRYDKELRHGAFRYAVSQALKSLDNSKKVELTERQHKTILTLIKNNKRDYRDIYADFMNESDWSVEEGYRAGDKLAVRIMSPDFNAEDYTPEERKRIADKLDFKDLKRELKNGSMRMELETVQKLANGFENEIEEIRKEKKALEKKIEDNAEASADETRRLKYLHEKELEKIDKREQAREVQKLKVKLLKSITRKVRFDAVNYEEGQKIIAIQQLFTPQLEKYVDSFLNSEEPYLRDALSQYKVSYDYRRRLQALAQRTGGGSGIRKMIKIFDTKPFEKWTEEDKRIVARYLPRTDWIKELDLEELTKRNKSVLRFDLQSEETQKLLADLLPPDLLSLVTNKKMKDWTLDDVEELAGLVDDLRREGREKLRQKKEVEIARAEKLRDRIEREILSNGLHIDEDDTPEEKERKQKAIEKFKKEKLPKILGIGAATKGTLKASQEKQSAFKRLLHGYGDMNMKRFARMLDNGESGINTTLLVDQENDCFNKEHNAIFERSSKIEKVLKDNGLKVEDLSKIVEVDFGGEKQEYTIDELLYFRAASKDEKSRYAVMCGNMFDETIKAAYRQTPEKQQAYLRMCKVKFKNVLNAAEKVLDDNPALADFANAIAEDYSEQYGRMNEICIKEFNTPMGRVDCYVPLVRLESNGDTNENKIKADMLGATGSTANNNVDDGMRKQRVDISPANQKPVEVGLYKTWCKSLNRTEHFIAYAPYIRELHRVYTGRDGAKMRQYIENRYGQGALQYIKDYINEVANPDVSSSLSELDRVVRALRGKTAPAYLGWKISGIIKQACTSPFPFMQYASPAEYGRAVFDFLRHKEMGEVIKAKSAYMNSRVFDPMIDLLKEQEEKETKPLFAKYDAFLKMGMQGLEAVDWYCVAPGWLAVYRKELQKLNSAEAKQARYDRAYKAEIAEAKAQYGDLASLGDMQLQIEADARAAAEAERDISEDEIEKRAVAKADEITRMCQPSARLADLSPLFKERGKGSELSRAFLQFTTSLNVIWQNIRYDLPNALKRKQWKQAIGTLTGYVLAGVLVGMVSKGLPEPTDDDKDKEKRLRKIAYYSITQFTDSIPILGNIATNTAERLVAGENKYQGNSDLFPIISKIQNGLYAAEREDYLKALSNFGYAAGLAAGVPVSGLKEAGYTVGIGDGDGKLQPHPTAFLGRRPIDTPKKAK